MAFYQFVSADGPYGSFETFEVENEWLVEEHNPDSLVLPKGWYWWACFPGCLPDGEANGPFASELDAIQDAQDGGCA